MNSEAYDALLSAQMLQNWLDRIALYRANGYDQKHTAKATERFLKVNKLDIFNGQASHDLKAKEDTF